MQPILVFKLIFLPAKVMILVVLVGIVNGLSASPIPKCSHVFMILPELEGHDSTGDATFVGIPQDMVLSIDAPQPSWPHVRAFNRANQELLVIPGLVEVPTTCGRILKRIWTAIDLATSSNSTSSQLISFIDEDPPLLKIPADTTLFFDEGIPSPQDIASDNSEKLVVHLKEQYQSENDGNLSIIRTWTAVDGCGHRAQATQKLLLQHR